MSNSSNQPASTATQTATQQTLPDGNNGVINTSTIKVNDPGELAFLFPDA